MRIAVVYFASEAHLERMKGLAKSLALGLQSQDPNHQVTLIDAFRQPEVKLTSYQFVAMGVETISWFRGSLSNNVKLFLATCGNLVGKLSYAFSEGKWLGAQRTLLRFMDLMESQGMRIRLSDVLFKNDEAEDVGQTLKID